MSNEVKLSTFPSNRTEALALLYLRSQNLSGKSPSEIQTMYFEVCSELRKDYTDKIRSGFFKALEEA